MIRHQMEETRTSLQDKLETLEQQVKETVHQATEAVTDTVSSVKEAVQDTVGTVKDSVQETVDTVKDTFDLRHQVERHPWAMFCGAAAVGFLGERVLERVLQPAPSAQFYPAATSTSYQPPPAHSAYEELSTPAAAPPPPHAPSSGWLETLTSQYGDEINKVKGMAISTLGGLLGEMLLQSVPPALKDQVKEVVDGVTKKLGGHPLEKPLFSSTNSGNGAHTQEETGPAHARRQWEEGASRFDR